MREICEKKKERKMGGNTSIVYIELASGNKKNVLKKYLVFWGD